MRYATLLVVLLAGCTSIRGVPVVDVASVRSVPPGLVARNVRTTGRIVAPVLPVFNADSIEVSGSWTLPPASAGGQWGPIQSLQVCALGGAVVPPAVLGDNSPAACRELPGTTSAATIRLPFDLSGMGDLTGSVWKVRMCVTTRRHQQSGPQVCAEHEFPLDAPAPAGVTGLTVTSRVVSP